MEWYLIFKYVHILLVIIWLGGGFTLVLLAARAYRATNNADLVQILRNVVFMSTRVFIPSAVAVLVAGIIMLLIGGYGMPLWIWIGLLGFAATFGTGALVLGPRSGKVVADIDQRGTTPEAVKEGTEILKIAQFDFVMLFVVVFDMVYKPTFSNWIVLILMVLAIAGAGYYFIGDIVRPMIEARMKKTTA